MCNILWFRYTDCKRYLLCSKHNFVINRLTFLRIHFEQIIIHKFIKIIEHTPKYAKKKKKMLNKQNPLIYMRSEILYLNSPYRKTYLYITLPCLYYVQRKCYKSRTPIVILCALLKNISLFVPHHHILRSLPLFRSRLTFCSSYSPYSVDPRVVLIKLNKFQTIFISPVALLYFFHYWNYKKGYNNRKNKITYHCIVRRTVSNVREQLNRTKFRPRHKYDSFDLPLSYRLWTNVRLGSTELRCYPYRCVGLLQTAPQTERQQSDGRDGVPADPDRGQVQVRSPTGRARPGDQLLQPGRPERRELEHVRVRPATGRVPVAPAVRRIRLLAVRHQQGAGQPRDSVPLRGGPPRVRAGTDFLGQPRLHQVISATPRHGSPRPFQRLWRGYPNTPGYPSSRFRCT